MTGHRSPVIGAVLEEAIDLQNFVFDVINNSNFYYLHKDDNWIHDYSIKTYTDDFQPIIDSELKKAREIQ